MDVEKPGGSQAIFAVRRWVFACRVLVRAARKSIGR